MSPWERGLLGACQETFPLGTTRRPNGVFIHERPGKPDETIMWFQRNALFHFSSEHPYNLSNPNDLRLVLRFAAASFLKLSDPFNIAFAFEATSGGIQDGSHQQASGIDIILDVAHDPQYRTPDLPLRTSESHLLCFEPPPHLQARYLIDTYGFKETMDYLVERELEFVHRAGISIERSAFMEELRLTDSDKWQLRALPAGKKLWANAAYVPKGFTLLHGPQGTGPYYDIAKALWDFRNQCAAQVLRPLGKQLPSFSHGGSDHAEELAQQIDTPSELTETLSPEIVQWKDDLLAAVPNRHNGPRTNLNLDNGLL